MNRQTDPAGARRNLLAYLGRFPVKFSQSKLQSPEARRLLAETALNIGNCLLWIVPDLEPGEPRHEQPLNETAQSLWALGTQLRQVGLALWDTPPAAPSDVERLALEVSNMSRALDRITMAVRSKEAFEEMRAAVGKDSAP